MELHQKIVSEYLQLRRVAERKGGIVFSRRLINEGIREITVDHSGASHINLTDPNLLDIKSVWQRLKDNEISSRDLSPMIRLLLSVFSKNNNVQNSEYVDYAGYLYTDSVTIDYEWNKIYRATFQVQMLRDGSADKSIVFWSLIPGKEDQTIHAEVHEYTGSFARFYDCTHRISIWDSKFSQRVMNLLFRESLNATKEIGQMAEQVNVNVAL